MRCQQNLAEPISTFGIERVWLAVLLNGYIQLLVLEGEMPADPARK